MAHIGRYFDRASHSPGQNAALVPFNPAPPLRLHKKFANSIVYNQLRFNPEQDP